MRRTVCVCALFMVVAGKVLAQSPNATVTGEVVDPSGAAIADVTVEVINEATNVKYSTKTNREGIYVIPELAPATYRIEVSHVGFKTVLKPDVIFNVRDVVAINFKLPVGALSETVTVEGGAPMVNTTDASVSTVVDQTYVKNMPLNGRSFQDLILLTPGVVTQSSQSGATATSAPALGVTGEFSVNGQRPESNYYMVDGVSGNLGAASGASMINGGGPSGSVPAATALGTTQALVSVDDLQEFRVQSSTYSAEYGRNPGAQLAFETKSGTNQWHGSASEYLRNDALDATDFFTNYQRAANAALTKPALRQNDFDATFGGPVRIPGAYNGKDKTFFFVSYEGLRLRQPQPAGSFPVPDDTLRQQTAATGAPLDQVLNAFPVQTPGAIDDQANGVGRFVGNWSNPASLDATSVRFDHAIKDKTRLFFRFSNTTSDSTLRGTFGLPATMKSATAYTTRTYTGGATVLLTNRFSNDFRLNYSSNETTGAQSIDQFGGSQPVDLAKLTGLGPLSNVLLGFALGSDFLILNQSQAAGKQRQWNLVDTASYSVGRHQLKFGVDYRRLTPFAVPNTATAEYIYFDASTVQSNSPDFYAAGLSAAAYPLYTNFSFFGQDEWRVSPRLSLSMGLRWEVNPAPGVTQGLMPYAVRGSTPDTYAVAPQGTPLWNTTWYNFAPRLGAAYILRDRQGWETVIRSGGGLFFDTAQQLGSNGFNGPGFNSFTRYSGMPASSRP